ncbi:TPA: phage tail tape measure protein [Serratia marcescens]|uniref:Phage tail tape measure protein n=2 Tax=Serratia marcescens TaxID=615 RepID=A0AB33G5N8_SERMA|nr:phage tail length tape measure protein [Serratia marcescens]AKL43011.1 phage tail length tape measure protein [Serratia marcescens]AWL70340.1 phage tail tape measure protein [Serratia marcescens]MDP8606145.1 phage tail tape measure protein [Serratia marcescens]MDP8874773.1 phage tail tape measure protein [Serratia marcescens]HAT2213163.1 phage tail tape measure protein [Serratia marcescens]
MADTAQLVVGLQLNDTNFKNKLTAAYRTAGEQSAKFNRQAQQDAKKTDESYQRIGGTLGGLAGKLAGLAGVELSLQGLAATSRQYGQALTELASITVAATAQMKQLDDAARQASSASGEGGSRAEEMLKLAGGLNDSAAAWRDQATAARGAAQATSGVGAASRVALGMLGGPIGVAIQAGLGMAYFYEQTMQAKEAAVSLKDAAILTTSELIKLSSKQLALRKLDLSEQLEEQLSERDKQQNLLDYANKRIERIQSNPGRLGDIFGVQKQMQATRVRAEAALESIDIGIQNTRTSMQNIDQANLLVLTGAARHFNQPAGNILPATATAQAQLMPSPPPAYTLDIVNTDNLGRERQQALDQYQQLRQEIEQAHLSSLEKITQDEQSAQAKLASTAKAAGAGQADVQRAMALNAEKYQRQRQQLAEQYAPGQAAVRKEQEVGKELKALYDGRLLTEREYHTASRMQQQETTRQRLKAETDALAAPRMNIAGDVDPVARLNNQLVQQQAQYQAYYQQGILDKERYEQLMQAATQESSDAQYQQALSLFGGQSRVHKMALGLVDMTRERTSGMMFDLLTGTQNFKQSMLGLMTSMTQSIIQQLIDLAMQALLTRTILSTFMNIGSGLLGGAASAGAGAAGSGAMGMPTGWQGYVPNAKGGVYASPSLSAFSGQIVSNPTLFAFARGAGLMGEAGPEAIMPLKRGADGSLGVRAIGGGTQPAAAPNVYITIENGGNVSSQADPGWGEFGKQMGNIAAQESQKVINRNLMPGQPIWKAIKGM